MDSVLTKKIKSGLGVALTLAMYGILFFIAFYVYSKERGAPYRPVGATLSNWLYSNGFVWVMTFPALTIVLYSLFADCESKIVRFMVRAGVLALTVASVLLLRRFEATYMDIIPVLFAIQMVSVAVYIEIWRRMKTTRTKVACAGGSIALVCILIGGILLGPFIIPPPDVDWEFWGYMIVFTVFMLSKTAPQLFAIAVLLRRNLKQSVKIRRCVVACLVLLAGCATGEFWIARDEAKFFTALEAWKQTHDFLNIDEKAIREESDSLWRQRQGATEDEIAVIEARRGELFAMLFHDWFKWKRAWPNGRITIHWRNGHLDNSIY